MKQTFLKLTSILALLVAIGGMRISVSGQSVSEKSNKGHKSSIVGVWVSQVTRTNCETGEPIPMPNASDIQFTYAKGGTLLETIRPSTVRSPGNGIWKREPGLNEYSSTIRFMRYDAAGLFVGSGVVKATIILDVTGNHFTSTATNEVLDLNGTVIGTGCATSVATRFQ